MTRSAGALVITAAALLALATGCTSGAAPSGREWSRTYLRTYDRVWQAALASLAQAGYSVEEEDQARGYIRAESGEREAYRRVTLEVFVIRKPEAVRVDVQASGGQVDSAADIRRLEQPVLAFLDDLDVRLHS